MVYVLFSSLSKACTVLSSPEYFPIEKYFFVSPWREYLHGGERKFKRRIITAVRRAVAAIRLRSSLPGVLPDRVRVGVIASDGGDDPPWLLPLPDSHLVVTLRQHRAFVDVVDVDGDGGRGRRAVAAADQSHRVLSAQHQDVLALTLKVQDLKTSMHTHTESEFQS